MTKKKNPHKWELVASGMYWTEYKCVQCDMHWVEQWEDIHHYPEGGLTPFFGCAPEGDFRHNYQ